MKATDHLDQSGFLIGFGTELELELDENISILVLLNLTQQPSR